MRARFFHINERAWLLLLTVLLLCVGIIMIYSASSIYALENYHDSTFFLKRHVAFILIGALIAFLVMSVDYRRYKKYVKPLLILSFILLILVLIPGVGKEVGGARRWFRFKFISFQPSELANLAVIAYVADFAARKEKEIASFRKGFVPPMAVLTASLVLIVAEPDLGTIIALGMTVMLMLFIAGVRLRYLFSVILLSLPLLYLLIFSVPYRRMRILAFINPWLDPQGSGFQIIQSQLALGSGGILGVGLGHSRQKLFYLPAAHTDFIFSIVGEELGFAGTAAIVLLFIFFIVLGVKIACKACDKFGFFLAAGLLLILSLKAIINIGVSCGLFPTKGLPLPFISYGGSSLVFDMISVGLLLNISRRGDYQ